MPVGYVTKNFVKLESAFDKGYTTASLQGSARSSKTFSIVQWIIHRCITVPFTSVSIVRETTPAIKRSVYKDFIEIITSWGVDTGKLNKTELVYTFDNGSTVEFFSCENEQKLRGSKRQILYVNEANEISYIEWQQLQMRTTMFSIIDYNPSFSEEHWINQVNDERKTCWWISTYKDNPFLEQRIIDEIESLQKKNPSLWRVYGLGLRAIVEGLVFPNFQIVNYMPTETMRMRFAGQDLGYSQDPSAGVEVRFYGNDMYINEIFYRTHMLTNDLIREWKQLNWYPKIISESADPRLIDELYNAGLDIHPVRKYAGSIQAGIMKMQEFNIKVTAQSVNVIKELRNYTYRQDKEGKWLNEPVDSFNHCFPKETMIATNEGQKRIIDLKAGDMVLTRKGYRKVTKCFDNGMREVVYSEIKTDLGTIIIGATFDHRFNINGKWKKYVELTKGDNLYVLSSLMELNLDAIQTGSTQTTITTNGKKMENTIKFSCIMRCMNTTMARYPKVKLSIIKILILLTTTLAILWQSLRQNIRLSISRLLTGILSINKYFAKEALIKIIGIQGVQSLTATLHKVSVSAKRVVKSLLLPTFIKGSAAKNAIINGSTLRPQTSFQQSVSTVERNSCITSTSNKNAVPKNVRINYLVVKDLKVVGIRKEHVYDIEVEGEHEFFANGILVHNCIDATRYVVLEEILGDNAPEMSSAAILGLTGD